MMFVGADNYVDGNAGRITVKKFAWHANGANAYEETAHIWLKEYRDGVRVREWEKNRRGRHYPALHSLLLTGITNKSFCSAY